MTLRSPYVPYKWDEGAKLFCVNKGSTTDLGTSCQMMTLFMGLNIRSTPAKL